jgi:Uma2 family endonuclease
MTTRPQPRQFTAEEFIAWAMEQPHGRYELAGGQVVTMAAERIEHVRAKLAVVMALSAAIAARGLACEAMTDGVAGRVDARTVYEPDALVRCAERTPGDAVAIADPMIVVEVVSPSLLTIDSGAKLAGYFRLPSVRHYLVVNTEPRAVTHHRLGEDGTIATRIVRAGALELDPPGFAVEIGDFFATL